MMPMMRTNSWIPAVFNDLFDTDYMPKCNATAPAINVKESDKAYTVELAAPGMKKEDFNVHINDEEGRYLCQGGERRTYRRTA